MFGFDSVAVVRRKGIGDLKVVVSWRTRIIDEDLKLLDGRSVSVS